MPELEKGTKWWIRYVVVPIIGGGGLIAVVVALINPSSENDPTGEKPKGMTQPATFTILKGDEAIPELVKSFRPLKVGEGEMLEINVEIPSLDIHFLTKVSSTADVTDLVNAMLTHFKIREQIEFDKSAFPALGQNQSWREWWTLSVNGEPVVETFKLPEGISYNFRRDTLLRDLPVQNRDRIGIAVFWFIQRNVSGGGAESTVDVEPSSHPSPNVL